ncbi:hypothetical protein AB1285_20115 [Microbacterium sp. NRRL B-14842]|uniref:hypothetical protein n=1 Tax=Microbacterium sp. NRRL B-14842 TaxID=3162881 RepID=UPI003D288947
MRIEKKLNRLDGVTATVNYATEKASVTVPAGVDTAPAHRRGREDRLHRRRPCASRAGGCAARRRAAGSGAHRAAAAADRRRRAHRPGHRDGDDPGAPVHVLAVAVARARGTCDRVGGPGRSTRRPGSTSGTERPRWDTLISMGTLAALLWSLYALFFGTAGVPGMDAPVRADRGAQRRCCQHLPRGRSGVTTFILAGATSRSARSGRAGAALRALLELGAKEVAVLRDGVRDADPDERAAGRGPVRRASRGEDRHRRCRGRRHVRGRRLHAHR